MLSSEVGCGVGVERDSLCDQRCGERLQIDRHDHAGVTEVRWDIVAPACSLQDNDIGAEGAQHVVRALENNQVLTTL